MLEYATDYSPDILEGRWRVKTRHNRHEWEIILEPEPIEKVVIVVTAYPVDKLQ